MSSPQEKAKELQKSMFQKIFDIDNGVHTIYDEGRYIASIQCAIIAVDEIIKAGEDVDEFADGYFQQVKTELQKL